MDDDRLIDMEGFGQRLRDAIFPEKPTAFANRIGVNQPTLFKYLKPPPNFSPSLEIIARIAKGAGCSIDYLATGRGDAPQVDDEVVKIPRYDVALAAGAGSWNERKRKLDDIPFTRAFLLNRLFRTSTKGLAVVTAKGDSMERTIMDGALVLIDEDDRSLVDGVMAFVLDGEARIKRFRKTIHGVQILSDNPAYPPELVENSDLDRIQVIGRAKWVGQLV